MSNSKNCGNCGARLNCFYRGIFNPCGDWSADAEIKKLRMKAQKCIGKPMSFDEGRFVQTCATAVCFSPAQTNWLTNIANRVLS
jgi:hypothetical protein